MQNKKGFTLTEVMVTLVLVGILAGILVPQIMNMRPSPNKVMFKKAYYELQVAVNQLINNLAAYPVVPATDENGETVEQGFNNETIDSAKMDMPTGVNKFCYLLVQQLNVVDSPACSNISGRNTFTTTDGIYWTIYTPGTAFPVSSTDYTMGNSTTLTVDVNGSTNAPNCSTLALGPPYYESSINACAGETIPDVYQVGVRYDGKLCIDSSDTNALKYLSEPTSN